jgi:micrococcal nuclease
MHKLFLLLLIPVICTAQTSNYKITRVIDGDTVEIEAPFLPPPLKPVLSIRVLGVDTPEKDFRAKCQKENDLAHKATEFTKHAIESADNITVEIIQPDKFFRLDGDVILDGNRLSTLLITNGFARPYFGDKKQSWCD